MEISLHAFRCLVDYQFDGEDRIQKQHEFLTGIGINTDFSNEVSNNIRSKCKELGLSGWVISPFWEPTTGESWYNTWYDLLKSGNGQKI